MIGKCSTLLIGDSEIADLSHYSNIERDTNISPTQVCRRYCRLDGIVEIALS